MWYEDKYGNHYHTSKNTMIIKSQNGIYQETYKKGEIVIQVSYTYTHRILKLIDKVRKATFKEYNADINSFDVESIVLPENVFDEWKKTLI